MAWRAEPSLEYLRQKERLAQLEKERGPGEFFKPRKSKPKKISPTSQPPVAANDNAPVKVKSFSEAKAILSYRNHQDHEPEPLRSNWATVPADETVSTAQSEKLSSDFLVETKPSPKKLEKAIEAAKNGDIEYYPNGTIARIGTLKFADGKKHCQKVTVIGPFGDVEEEWQLLPGGAMLGCSERLTTAAGGQGTAVTLPNDDTCMRMGVAKHTFIPKGTTITGRDYTPEETQAKIDEAIANTAVMPPVTKCPPGIAAGTACYSDQFIGGKIGSTGKGGAVQWYDVFAARRQQIEEREAHDALSTADKRALRAALTAASFEEVGIAAGLSPIYAKKGGGKARLLAANDNLDAALKKIAG